MSVDEAIESLTAKVMAVRLLHKAAHSPAESWAAGYKWTGHHCSHDGQHWPCETITALEES